MNAIVTRGVHGAVASTTTGTWAVGSVPARLRGPYSVGSGDAFLAGYAVALARGEPPADALRLGAAAGTANARTPGQGELDPDEVRRLAPRFAITRLPDA